MSSDLINVINNIIDKQLANLDMEYNELINKKVNKNSIPPLYNKQELIGPESCDYFKNIIVGDDDVRNIVLLGDVHVNDNKTEYNEECNNDFYYIVYELFKIYERFNKKNIPWDESYRKKYKITKTAYTKIYDSIYNERNIKERYKLYIKQVILKLLVNKPTGQIPVNLYLYLTSEDKCIDYYDEGTIFHKDYQKGASINSWYHTAPDIIKRTSLVLNLCKQELYNNIRYHSTNIRAYQLNTIYSNFIQKTYKHQRADLSLVYNYIEYLMSINSSINESNNLLEELYKNSYYKDIEPEIKDYAITIDFLILKQFQKSIFYKNKTKLLNVVLYKMSKVNKETMGDINDILESSTGAYSIEMIKMNVYLLFRMFIDKNKWERELDSVDSKCASLSYPKYIIVYVGKDHATWIKEFIKIYFKDNFDYIYNKEGKICKIYFDKDEYLPLTEFQV